MLGDITNICLLVSLMFWSPLNNFKSSFVSILSGKSSSSNMIVADCRLLIHLSLDNLEYWTQRHGFRIPGTGSLSAELGFSIPIVKKVSDSLSCDPNFKA